MSYKSIQNLTLDTLGILARWSESSEIEEVHGQKAGAVLATASVSRRPAVLVVHATACCSML